MYIVKALLEGADGVMVSGCHPGDCHYLVGNYHARRRFVVLKKLLTTAGIEPDRVQFTWVSASEGARFADVIKEVTEKVQALGPSSILEKDSSLTPLPQNNKHTRHPEPPPCHSEPPPCRHSELDSQSPESLCNSPRHYELISTCKKLLEDGTVKRVIGFRQDEETGQGIPYIFTSPNDAEKLVWNNRCIANLSGYLLDNKAKTAITAKPCDARAVINLIVENQLNREDVYVIEPDSLSETTKDSSLTELSQNDNTLSRFRDEMSKCILCYSCRQSCYGCYCKTCFTERSEPDWQTTSPDMGAKMLYHLGRCMHLAGRCVECGACETACASGVNIRYLIQAVSEFIEDTYYYQAGMDLDTEPAMLTYKTDDLEIGFLGFESEVITSDSKNSDGGDTDAK